MRNAPRPAPATAAVVAYVRVSSRAHDLGMKQAAVERSAAARGDAVVTWYAEKRSARTMARPELDRLRADARAGLLRKLYVFRLDRLSRSGIRDTFEVVEELHRHGVELVTVSDGFSLDGPAAEIILAVMAWSARMERLAINERIAAARERVEAEGGRWGRPPRLDAADASRVRELRAAGRSLRGIAVALKVPLSTVARACRKIAATQAVEAPALRGLLGGQQGVSL
jgi:DNA invertase Pin-like site-specific DNA recombinase